MAKAKNKKTAATARRRVVVKGIVPPAAMRKNIFFFVNRAGDLVETARNTRGGKPGRKVRCVRRKKR